MQVAQNLYAGRMDSQVVSLLLEISQFCLVTELAVEYFSDAIAAWYTALNQVLSSADKEMARVQKWSRKRKADYQAAWRAEILKISVKQPNLDARQRQFLIGIKDIKKSVVTETASLKIDWAALRTRQIMEELYTKLRKGQDKPEKLLLPEEMADALLNVLGDLPLKDRTLLE